MRAWLVLLVLLAGCTASVNVPDEDRPTPPRQPEDQPPGDPPPTQGPAAALLDGFVRDEQGPVGGAEVVVGATGLRTTSASDGTFRFDDVPPGRHVVRATLDARNGSVTVDLAAGDARTIFIDLGQDVVAPPPEPAAAAGFACPGGEVTEPHATFGQADGMVWAALKTGFRAIIAWPAGSLEYTIDGGAPATASASPLILDGLPKGKTVCFRNGGAWHALSTANAMDAYAAAGGPATGDPPGDPASGDPAGGGPAAGGAPGEEPAGDATGVYTANFLILANERTDRLLLAKGVERSAHLIWDATDGHVRVGTVVVVIGDLERQQEALQPCWNGNPGVHVSVFSAVFCDRLFDVIFTHNVHPAAAGATYTDGIQDPDVPIWMNALHEAGLLSGLFTQQSQIREVGSVLAHEVGHYMFGAQDLYPEAGVVRSNCYDPSTGISIMSSSRDATEFDSAGTPCRDASSGYTPTWTLMKERFPAIPERPGPPLDGPHGDGGAFSYHEIVVGA